MRFSILGFSQERALSIFLLEENIDPKKEPKKTSLDVVDLLILNLIADFPNRTSVKKVIIDETVYFWASYDEVLKELPILNIKKQALADRFEKLEKLNLIRRKYINIDAKHQNATFFALTKTYESLLYERRGYSSELQQSIVVNYDTHNNNNNDDNSSSIDNKKENSQKEKSEVEAFVDKVYAMYPTKCPVRGVYLGKTLKDKDRIKSLLKKYSQEDILRVMQYEIDNAYGKYRMKNFSTFLNNFPDPQALFANDLFSTNSTQQQCNVENEKEMVINGQTYR